MHIDGEIQRLIQITLRTFYEAKYIILIDQLVRKEAMKDDELAARVGVREKEVAKIANKLAEDGLLASHRRNELKPGAFKATPRTWYYIDIQRTIDVIKWRMFKIRKVIDDKLRNEIDSQGYVCPRCKKSFGTLDASSLIDFHTNTMRCDVCGAEVVDNENIEDVKRSKDQMNRLLKQTRPIVEGLKKTESLPLKAFNIAAWLEKHHPISAADMAQGAGGEVITKVTVELVEGGEEEERRRKQAEADAVRQQNLLPSWIEKSTITGELTAAGAAQMSIQPTASTSYGIEITNGLSSPTKATADDDVDDYYTALAAAQAAAKAAAANNTANGKADDNNQHHGSPASGGAASSGNSKLVDSGYEEFADDLRSVSPASAAVSPMPFNYAAGGNNPHDKNSRQPSLRPPSAASVANSLGKRSREASDDDVVENEAEKKIRTAPNTQATLTPAPGDAADSAEVIDSRADEAPDADDDDDDDPVLTVAGKETRFSRITEEMTGEMTPEEYQIYWDTMSIMDA